MPGSQPPFDDLKPGQRQLSAKNENKMRDLLRRVATSAGFDQYVTAGLTSARRPRHQIQIYGEITGADTTDKHQHAWKQVQPDTNNDFVETKGGLTGTTTFQFAQTVDKRQNIPDGTIALMAPYVNESGKLLWIMAELKQTIRTYVRLTAEDTLGGGNYDFKQVVRNPGNTDWVDLTDGITQVDVGDQIRSIGDRGFLAADPTDGAVVELLFAPGLDGSGDPFLVPVFADPTPNFPFCIEIFTTLPPTVVTFTNFYGSTSTRPIFNIVGGGGGGGGGREGFTSTDSGGDTTDFAGFSGSGGGSGGYTRIILNAPWDTVFTLTIGDGGAGGLGSISGSDGSAGGTTSVMATLPSGPFNAVAFPGNGGRAGAGANAGSGGGPGSVTGPGAASICPLFVSGDRGHAGRMPTVTNPARGPKGGDRVWFNGGGGFGGSGSFGPGIGGGDGTKGDRGIVIVEY